MPRFSNTANFENSDANVVIPERDRIAAEGARGGFSFRYHAQLTCVRSQCTAPSVKPPSHPQMVDIHQRILPKIADPCQNTLGGHQINGGVVEMRLFLDVLRLRNGNGNLNKPPYQGLDISMGEQTSQSLERYIAATDDDPVRSPAAPKNSRSHPHESDYTLS